jgi:hypothetical protein
VQRAPRAPRQPGREGSISSHRSTASVSAAAGWISIDRVLLVLPWCGGTGRWPGTGSTGWDGAV